MKNFRNIFKYTAVSVALLNMGVAHANNAFLRHYTGMLDATHVMQDYNNIASILVDNIDADSENQLRNTIESLKDSNISFLFRLGSDAEKLLTDIPNDQKIAFTYNSKDVASNSFKTLLVENSEAFADVLRSSLVTIASKGSTEGIALALTNGEKDRVFFIDASRAFANEILSWSRSTLETSLRNSIHVDSLRHKNIAEIFDSKSRWTNRAEPESAENLSIATLEKITRLASTIVVNEQKLQTSKLGNYIPGGAVIFGSSRGPDEWKSFVQASASFLSSRNIPVTTGGAGGYMAVANNTAILNGSPSIGIPMGGIAGEEHSNPLVSMEVRTSSYKERINLLLAHKEVVIFAPGTAGTRRELAATLIEVTKRFLRGERIPKILFLSSYYENLAAGLKNSTLPKPVRESFYWASSEDDAVDALKVIVSGSPRESLVASQQLLAEVEPYSQRAVELMAKKRMELRKRNKKLNRRRKAVQQRSYHPRRNPTFNEPSGSTESPRPTEKKQKSFFENIFNTFFGNW